MALATDHVVIKHTSCDVFIRLRCIGIVIQAIEGPIASLSNDVRVLAGQFTASHDSQRLNGI